MSSMYLRGDRYYFRVPRNDGTWTSVRSEYIKGQEKVAKKALDNMEALSVATAKLVPLAGGPLTLARYSAIWIKEREKAGVVDWQGDHGKMRDHVLPFMGDMELNSIRPKHLLDLMNRLIEKKGIGRKTRRNVYGVIKSLLRDAKIADLFAGEDPCILPPMAFGNDHEKDPEWRSKAIFSAEELVRLVSDEAIPEDRRVFYGLMGIGGCRLGEAEAVDGHENPRRSDPRAVAIT